MKRVVIIGASSGIGEALARDYASQGCRVGIAARRKERLQQIKEVYPQQIEYSEIDVVSEEASAKFLKLVDSIGGMDLLVYCSGYGKHSKELLMEIERATVDVNVRGFQNIVVPAFNYFLNHSGEYRPHIVTISSVASFRGLGASPAYSATKRFQAIYFEALGQLASLNGAKIDFTAIKPGFIATDFISRSYFMTMKLDYVVKRIKRAIERRKKNCVIDWRWRIVVGAMQLIPTSIWRKIKVG